MPSTMAEYRARRAKMIEFLGGKCVQCGDIKNLHIDHIIASEKLFDISSNWSRSWDFLEPELEKCQLLCKAHHETKSLKNGDIPKRSVHGTRSMYRHQKCRCELCKKAQTDYMREYKRKRKIRSGV